MIQRLDANEEIAAFGRVAYRLLAAARDPAVVRRDAEKVAHELLHQVEGADPDGRILARQEIRRH